MAAPFGRIAVACLALFAAMATGCMISRPCNWDEWHYQSSDGRQCYRDNADESPPIEFDQQVRTRPRHTDYRAASRAVVSTEKPPAKPKVAPKPNPPAVATVQWQEPNEPPAVAKRSKPQKHDAASSEDANPRPAKPPKPVASEPQAAPVAGPADRTPFNWGFFGAETRW